MEKEKTDKLRIWLAENNITTGVNIDEDTKRYYPHSSLASNIIGFTGSDNQGLEGLESYYDDILRGTHGKILKLTDATPEEILLFSQTAKSLYEIFNLSKDLLLYNLQSSSMKICIEVPSEMM